MGKTTSVPHSPRASRHKFAKSIHRGGVADSKNKLKKKKKRKLRVLKKKKKKRLRKSKTRIPAFYGSTTTTAR